MPSLSLGGTVERGTSSVSDNLIDINGDGLPDRVYASGGSLTVQLNLGYAFAAPEVWGSGAINYRRDARARPSAAASTTASTALPAA